MMLAAALVVLAANSCNKDNISDAPAQDSMVVKFTANVAGTKAVFNPSSFEGGAAVPVLWKTGDKLMMYVKEKVLLKLPDLVGVNLPNGAECSESATWTHDFAPTYDPTSENYVGHMPEAPFTFYAFCPGASMRGFYSGSQHRIRVDTVPSEQTPEQNTCDPKAMCIYSISETYGAWPDEVEMHEFRHMTAYGCITLGAGIPEDAVVAKVKITANEGQYLAGDAWYYYAGEKEGLWEDFKANSRTETITINTASKENIWFGCCPTTDLESLTVEVYTEEDECYVVEKAIPAGKNFEAGKVAKMKINGFEKVVEEPEEQVETVTYVWEASSTGSGFVVGEFEKGVGNGLIWNDDVVSQTFVSGDPELTWTVDATCSKYSIVDAAKNGVQRLKIGEDTNPFKITISPTEGYKVKDVTVHASAVNGNYRQITIKVGDNVLVQDQPLLAKLTLTDNKFYGQLSESVQGDVFVEISTIEEKAAKAIYLYKVVLTLEKQL